MPTATGPPPPPAPVAPSSRSRRLSAPAPPPPPRPGPPPQPLAQAPRPGAVRSRRKEPVPAGALARQGQAAPGAGALLDRPLERRGPSRAPGGGGLEQLDQQHRERPPVELESLELCADRGDPGGRPLLGTRVARRDRGTHP